MNTPEEIAREAVRDCIDCYSVTRHTFDIERMERIILAALTEAQSAQPVRQEERNSAYKLAMLGLQSSLYAEEVEFADAVNEVLCWTKAPVASAATTVLLELSEELLRHVTIQLQDSCIQINPANVYPVLRAAFAKLLNLASVPAAPESDSASGVSSLELREALSQASGRITITLDKLDAVMENQQ